MYSPVRTVFLGVNLVVFALLVIVGAPAVVTPAAAAPAAFYSTATSDNTAQHRNTSTPVLVKHLPSEYETRKRDSLPSIQPHENAEHLASRDLNSVVGYINVLNTNVDKMNGHSSNFGTLVERYSSDGTFQQEGVEEVSGFQDSLGGFSDILAELAADKGLANYDRDSVIETILKQVVNANKDLLKNVDIMVYQLPAVGGTLGPLVYQIKCLLDEILDATENLSDAIINQVEPLLEGIISDASRTACNSGIAILGLCLL